jgi:hypothetical protein
MFKEIPENCRYGYVRVNSKAQEENSSLESQKKELLRHGFHKKTFVLKSDPLLTLSENDLFSTV